jgi:hypothetical protein
MMRSAIRLDFGMFLPCAALLALTSPLIAQQATANLGAAATLPDAPRIATAYSPAGDASAPLAYAEKQGSSSSQDNSTAQTAAPPPDAQKPLTSEEQLKLQEKQHILGVMATFNTTSDRNALPLSPKQKFQLFIKGETDPWPFALAAVVAGVGMADDSYPEWGYGAQGYGKRFGAAYADSFIGNFFGNAVLTSVLHEDPRYFQKGTGTKMRRFLWAASSTIWCRRDKGTWGPNYANVGGNLIGAAIARVYYPPSERTVGNTISDGFTVSAEGIIGSEVIEFWPDIARHYKRKREEKMAAQATAAARK